MKPPRAVRAHITEERIVEAALELIHDEPSGTFTLSKLAKHLGISAPTIYSHVPNKQYIIERVRSRVVADIDCSSFETKPWDAALADWARSYADAFAKHPETIPLLTTNPVQAPELIAQYEVIARSLLQVGWPPGEIVAVFTVVESFVLGSVLDLVAPVQMVQPAADGDYPVLRSLIEDETDALRAKQTFELGLETLIVGFTDRLESLRAGDARRSLEP
ncbi:TetR/AcrR family transcriptional regulator C-terminal domain-containing protein [Leucobacter weissii]|uniref:TetR/AcrR family transcriptional regulator C-terminal domain-containing protein n=1 Tax=Leucobacter weissii TaxID=1983706 RepID=A0A939MKY2_9MICO|nr:TetR/AcrR family transcriptional regulator C-terminal domain-containing protein [Leucobacter weissii]MBO1902663.1 TetR/AcrR family transcriptional regulator C-terminal domain-containing protein [Leucobacter weissii]